MIRIVGKLVDGPGRPIPVMLAKLSDSLKDWRDFWVNVFIPRYLLQVQQNFETEGELSGTGWPALEPRYAAWKARHFPVAKILERTRRLRESLAPGANGSDTVLQAGPDFLLIGTRVPYGQYHMSRRPFLVRVESKEWAPVIHDWMVSKAAEAGLSTAFPGAVVGRGPGGRFMKLAF